MMLGSSGDVRVYVGCYSPSKTSRCSIWRISTRLVQLSRRLTYRTWPCSTMQPLVCINYLLFSLDSSQDKPVQCLTVHLPVVYGIEKAQSAGVCLVLSCQANVDDECRLNYTPMVWLCTPYAFCPSGTVSVLSLDIQH